MAFHVGQKVMCVDAGPNCVGDYSALIHGEIYSVAELVDGPEGQAVVLWEIPMPSNHWYGFNPTRFRPIVSKSTDTGMAILREILARESNADKPPMKQRQKEKQ